MRRPSIIRLDKAMTEDSTCDGLARRFAGRTKLLLQAMGVTVALTVSVWGNAASLGAINVISALGQPLTAEIELSDIRLEDRPLVRLASAEAYKSAGLDYPSGVQYRFDLVKRANGEPYLRVSSDHEITDSFVSLLVELSWKSGRLVREYSFLLDPPGYTASQSNTSATQIIAPAAVNSESPVENQPVSDVETKPPVAEIHQQQANAGKAEQATTHIVKQGDYLQKIAAENKPVDVSLDRMLVALYRANADQFDGENMNRIKSGKRLRIPAREEIDNVTQTEAVADVHAQVTDWNTYRQKLAGVATARHETETSRQSATGKITTPLADNTPVANESSREVLRLSREETPGSPLSGRTRQKNVEAEDAIAKAKALEDGKMRVVLLEKNLQDMKKLAKLKAEAAELIAAESKGASSVPAIVAAVTPVTAISDVAAVSAVKPAVASSVSPIAGIKSYLLLGMALLMGGLGYTFIRYNAVKAKRTVRTASDATVLAASPGFTPVETLPDDMPAQAAGLTELSGTTKAKLPDETVDEASVNDEVAENAPLSLGVSDSLNSDAASQEAEMLPGLESLIIAVSKMDQDDLATPADKALEEDDEMEFTLDLIEDDKSAPVINLSDISLDMGDVHPQLDDEAEQFEQWHDVATRLNLAKAYQEAGDLPGARVILNEVLQEGDEVQKQEAQLLITQLS